MRVITQRWAILSLALLMSAGCRSGGGWSWPGSRLASKTPPAATSSLAKGPTLPSTSFPPATANGAAIGAPTSSYASAPPYTGSSGYGANAYNAATAAAPQYGQTPYGGGYPETPTNYVGTAGTAAGSSYGSPASTAYSPPTYPTNTSSPYCAASPYGAGATAGSVAPQVGPYDAAAPYGQQATSYAAPYGAAGAAQPGAGPSAYVADNRYSTGSRYDGTSAGAASPHATSPYGTYTQPATGTDRYGNPSAVTPTGGVTEAYPSTSPSAGMGPSPTSPAATPYQPGSSDYQPGNTGYRPPGVPPYQSPAGPYTNSPTGMTTEPRYRPGGTSDYSPTSSTSKPATGLGAPATSSGVTPAAYEATKSSTATPATGDTRYSTPSSSSATTIAPGRAG